MYMKKYILIFICLFAFLTAHAQLSKTDSLENVLRNHPQEDTTKVNILNEIATTYRFTNPKKILKKS